VTPGDLTVARRCGRRGGGLLLFLVALLPLTLIGVVLAVDYTQVLMAKRQATNTADVMAMAAATALYRDTGAPGQDNLDRIDPDEANRRAEELFQRALQSGMLPENLRARWTPDFCYAGESDCLAEREVAVTVSYEVPRLFVVDLIVPGAQTSLAGSVRRSAKVCDPLRVSPSGPGCAYPAPVGG